MGLGGLGGGAQMLFGGSGGQDIFQKITWILGALFMFGSLSLALLKTSQRSTSFEPITTQEKISRQGTMGDMPLSLPTPQGKKGKDGVPIKSDTPIKTENTTTEN